jgi:2-dehydropantoate 2-reductase
MASPPEGRARDAQHPVIHHMDHGLVAVGEHIEGPNPRDRAIVDLFASCRIRCRMLASLRHGRWEKRLWNVPFSGLGAALDLTSDRLIASAEGIALARKLMAEVLAGAAANGARLAPELAEEKIELTRTMGPYKSSMQIDRELRRPMEVEAILGEPTRRAIRQGVAVPCMEMLYRMLHLVNLDNLRAGG